MKAVSDVAARHSPDWHTLTHQQSSAFELLHPLLHCSLCSPQLVALEGKDSHHWMSPSTFLPRSHCTPYPFWVILPLYKDPGTFLHSWEAIQPIQKQGCRTKIKCLCHFLYYSISNCWQRMPQYPSLTRADWNTEEIEAKICRNFLLQYFAWDTAFLFFPLSTLFQPGKVLSSQQKKEKHLALALSTESKGTSATTRL